LKGRSLTTAVKKSVQMKMTRTASTMTVMMKMIPRCNASKVLLGLWSQQYVG